MCLLVLANRSVSKGFVMAIEMEPPSDCDRLPLGGASERVFQNGVSHSKRLPNSQPKSDQYWGSELRTNLSF